MLPTSITPWVGSMRMKVATPTALLVCESPIAGNSGLGHLRQPSAVTLDVGEGLLEQISPVTSAAVEGIGGEQVIGMACRLERVNPAEAAAHRRPWRPAPGRA